MFALFNSRRDESDKIDVEIGDAVASSESLSRDVASFLSQPKSQGHGRWNRRFFLSAIMSGTVVMTDPAWAASILPNSGCRGDCPVECILDRKMPTLEAFIEAQLHCLWRGYPEESPHEVACDVVRFVSRLSKAAQQAVCLVLTAIDFHSWKYAKRWFYRLTIAERLQLLNQGEFRPPAGEKLKYPVITWDDNFTFHTAISSLAMLTRLVTHSRLPARRLIGFRWSAQCMDPSHLAHLDPPPYPDLCATYDVCVIGSGAGGSVVAARAAEAGLSVLILEEGEWISPDGLVQRVPDEHGREIIWPARDDEGLLHLFQGSGVNLAGRLSDPEVDNRSLEEYLNDEGVPGLTFYGKLKKARPRQTINLLQARVVGGGPYINNAIHLEIEEEVWNRWPYRPPQSSYADLRARMERIKRDLGVNSTASRVFSGDRTRAFIDACGKAHVDVEPLPVSILPPEISGENGQSCAVCGADNIVDPFGNHIGGLHPLRPGRPASYFMRSLAAGAAVAYQMRAWRFQLGGENSFDGSNRHVEYLLAEDRRGLCPRQRGPMIQVRARAYVLAAGSVASTLILSRTACQNQLTIRGLGCNFNANVVTPVYAVFDRPVCHGGHMPEPGIAQCYFVRRGKCQETGQDEPALENWFHYPGSLAIALTGWFCEYASVMRLYSHLSICGMVVPTKLRPDNRVDCDGQVHLTIDRDEFELLLCGIRKIGRIFLAAATPGNGVTLHLPTKALLLDSHGHPVRIRTLECLDWALNEVRCRGPEFLNMATAHPQGGNSLGSVVDPATFRVQDAWQYPIDNLYAADASVLPAGCEVNPQLTIKALATYAADAVLTQFADAIPEPTPAASPLPK